jgi:hypothetical protein
VVSAKKLDATVGFGFIDLLKKNAGVDVSAGGSITARRRDPWRPSINDRASGQGWCGAP